MKTIPKTILILAIAVAFVAGTAVSSPNVFAGGGDKVKLDEFKVMFVNPGDPIEYTVELWKKGFDSDKEEKISSVTQMISDGDTIANIKSDMDAGKWESATFYRFYDGDTLVHQIPIHTSCSKALENGDTFDTNGSDKGISTDNPTDPYLQVDGDYTSPDPNDPNKTVCIDINSPPLPPAECENGTGNAGECTSCDPGFELNNGFCVIPLPPAECENGTGNAGECTSCDPGFIPDGNGFCVEDPDAFCQEVNACLPEPLDGLNCWDLNENHIADFAGTVDGMPDYTEDLNDDGAINTLDCRGPQGDQGDQGDQGPPGTDVDLSCDLQLLLQWVAEDHDDHDFRAADECQPIDPEEEVCEEPTVFTITAGQTHDVGDVTVTNSGENLIITVDADEGVDAIFHDYNLGIYDSLADVPNSPDRPPIGQLTVGSLGQVAGDIDSDPFEIIIPLSVINGIDTDMDGTVIVLHLNVWSTVDGEMEENTAFGGNNPGAGNAWWFHDDYIKCVIP